MKTSLAIVPAFLLSVVHARPEFANRVPNGANVPGIKALGHADGKGVSDELNSFGRAFGGAGMKWTKALCQADSDGDGQTNGQELGDPCCVWTSGATPKFSTGVSHPGDATKKVDASVLASNACSTGNDTTTATTPAPATTSSACSVQVSAALVGAATTLWACM